MRNPVLNRKQVYYTKSDACFKWYGSCTVALETHLHEQELSRQELFALKLSKKQRLDEFCPLLQRWDIRWTPMIFSYCNILSEEQDTISLNSSMRSPILGISSMRFSLKADVSSFNSGLHTACPQKWHVEISSFGGKVHRFYAFEWTTRTSPQGTLDQHDLAGIRSHYLNSLLNWKYSESISTLFIYYLIFPQNIKKNILGVDLKS